MKTLSIIISFIAIAVTVCFALLLTHTHPEYMSNYWEHDYINWRLDNRPITKPRLDDITSTLADHAKAIKRQDTWITEDRAELKEIREKMTILDTRLAQQEKGRKTAERTERTRDTSRCWGGMCR